LARLFNWRPQWLRNRRHHDCRPRDLAGH
jgi:hypothetical protein